MKIISFLFISLMWVSMFCAASDNGTAGQITHESVVSDGVVKLKWSVPDSNFKAGDSIIATLAVTNIGNHKVSLTITSDPMKLINPMLSKDDKAVSATAYGLSKAYLQGNRMVYDLDPGEQYSKMICLNRNFDLSLAGTYKAKATLAYSLDDSSKFSEIQTGSIDFNITEVSDPASPIAPKIK